MTKPIPPGPEALYLGCQNENATLRQRVLAWLAHLEAQNYSASSLDTYRIALLPFVTWCEERGLMYAPQVSLQQLESYQRSLRGYRKADGRPLAFNSQLSRLGVIKNFFRWLLKRHVILYNPADLLELPKAETHLPAQVFSEQETRQVLGSLDTEKPLGLRNRAILEMFWSTGIRRMELANLMAGDVDFTRGVVNVRQGKGKKDRVVPVGHVALEWLMRYLRHVRPRLTQRHDSGHLFVTWHGKGMNGGTITQIAGTTIREKARIEKPGACHIFRHSMATQMLDNGADTRHIQAILGHEKLETTQIYTKIAIRPLQEVHALTHPAEQDVTWQERRGSDGAERQPGDAEPQENRRARNHAEMERALVSRKRSRRR
ncbi:site-specific tyrosine recombinase XerC [Salmonella enterica]|uniref:Recombinase XerD n=2 Tax=Salmonella enterica I TaxID=59201 RepID=A0A659RF15_SALET|nr:site-specific tyrosine recombinase XerC [Salmonella enterica]TGC34546.1 recombinase XerD [Salmonella enterica subsp. enterica serovar Wernigerode]TGC34551.1 recombinase XerD [Salmonella enterica subsp. enterica serovar Wernigerode]TGC41616.1 recombinase XerD [Salmonella enterica subsp. enterica serovar Wernigerode]TGC41621.1 recombinase XerD [Salmonella enterica subsp. enterica serovar Wernigerode]TGC99839.1 recombinase XerD [Salmonella enterica subsp. enterica serovar Wernigerode]